MPTNLKKDVKNQKNAEEPPQLPAKEHEQNAILLKLYLKNYFHRLPARGGHHLRTNHLYPTPGEFALFHSRFQPSYPTHHHAPII